MGFLTNDILGIGISAAPLLLLLNVLGFSEARVGAGLRSGALRLRNSNSIFDLASHQGEGLLHVLAVLRRSLQEAHAVVVGQLLTLFKGHSALTLEIALVAHEDAADVVTGVLLDFAHPGLNVAEALTVGDVVDHNDAVGALVVAGGDGLEAFLASSVPNLQLDRLAIHFNRTNLEVHSDGGHKVIREDIVLNYQSENQPIMPSRQMGHLTYSKAQQQGGFSDSGVSNEKDLEEVVAIREVRAKSWRHAGLLTILSSLQI